MASLWVELFSAILLFSLVFGMSATVELSHMRKQIHNGTALLIGIGLQFVLLPFIGFITVKALQLPATVGIMILVITSSPGGSYSNWWCSMFNADLALSVTMTALSTLLSTIMLPANLVLYTKFTYSASVVQSLDWRALFISLAVVIGGIGCGLLASHWANTTGNAVMMHRRANRMGNVAGLALILLSVSVSSSNQHAAIWDQDAAFYIACTFPPIIGLILAVSLASYYELDKPERVAVSIESCYQNTGIATTVALTMFQSETDLATAIGVPLMYGVVEGVVILSFCLICWKAGWTKAPANANLCTVIATSYEVENNIEKEEEPTAIEVVLSHHDADTMIFSQTDNGSYIIDKCTLDSIGKKDDNLLGKPTIKMLDVEDPTECSESDRVDDDATGDDEPDGIMVVRLPLHHRRRLYDVLDAPLSPTTTEYSSESTVVELTSDQIATASSGFIEPLSHHNNSQRTALRFGRNTVSKLHALATEYLATPAAGREVVVHMDDDDDPAIIDVPPPNCVQKSTQLPTNTVDDIETSNIDGTNECVRTHMEEPIKQDKPSIAKAVAARVAARSKSAVTKVATTVSSRRAHPNYETISTTSSPTADSRARETPSVGTCVPDGPDDSLDDCSL